LDNGWGRGKIYNTHTHTHTRTRVYMPRETAIYHSRGILNELWTDERRRSVYKMIKWCRSTASEIAFIMRDVSAVNARHTRTVLTATRVPTVCGITLYNNIVMCEVFWSVYVQCHVYRVRIVVLWRSRVYNYILLLIIIIIVYTLTL